jgi:hypothetical protein
LARMNRPGSLPGACADRCALRRSDPRGGLVSDAGSAPQLPPRAFQRGASTEGGIGKCKETITALRTRGLLPARYRAIQRSEEG